MGVGESKFEKDLTDNFPPNEHYFGFHNYGNTCYCNSVLQALYFCIPFRQHVLQYHRELRKNNPNPNENSNTGSWIGTSSKPQSDSMLVAIAELFYSIHSQKKKTGVIQPKDFIITLKRENELFRGTMHQDAHEFLNFLLNNIGELLQNEQKKKKSKDEANYIAPFPNTLGGTFIHDVFEGVLTNETRCLCCENVTSRDESFLDLSIDVTQNTSLSGCLRNFSSIETLSSTDKFYCDTCCALQEAQKRMRIKKLPNALVVHLKRFKYIESYQSHKKLNYRVVFPFELKLCNTSDDVEDPDRMYELFAIVVHKGNGPNHGHYISTIKSQNNWLLFDDERIQIVDPLQVKAFFGSPSERIQSTNCGYLLFYQSVQEKSL